MATQSLCSSLCFPNFRTRTCSDPGVIASRNQRFNSDYATKLRATGLKWVKNDFPHFRLNRAARVCASISDLGKNLAQGSDIEIASGKGNDGLEPLRGKPGSVSFYGITHQTVEEGKLESSPFKPRTGSFLWILAPLLLIMSLLLPSVLVGNVVSSMDGVVAEIVGSLFSEASFYAGLGTFLIIADRVQRPYLQFSAKRWSLITGLRGYLSSAFFTMGLKIVAPLFTVYIFWPELGMEGLAAVTPFLVGCFAQFLFEITLKLRGSSCWPLVPIIFEVYRVYQLTKSADFVQRLLYAMNGQVNTPQLMERSNAMGAMLMMFKVLAVVCLWSLITFLLRLFPSRPVVDNY